MTDQPISTERMIRDSRPEQPALAKLSPAQRYYLMRKRQKQRLGVIPQGT